MYDFKGTVSLLFNTCIIFRVHNSVNEVKNRVGLSSCSAGLMGQAFIALSQQNSGEGVSHATDFCRVQIYTRHDAYCVRG